ncbi:MAG TPA: Gfo/Idh/MocA family oxidoreductase [Thermoanaerobaculia bacterium]|jgi:UDP-N-acetyl-2-amino-2-deoxyglucuronate dehydrogenase|nr:Gfo/Idh/MocA family oxidoreductase [Thermoanaerobaculia bacterium]
MKNFALIGAGGYIAPRHMKAIRDTGNRIVAAVDRHDSVGQLDQYGFDIRFFTEIERFDRHIEKLRRAGGPERVHYVSVCSPNYLHDAHCRLGMRAGADVICEKPLVINPWNLDALEQIEAETGRRVNTVLQLRVHPKLLAVREQLAASGNAMHDVQLTYITARGGWYQVSWKGTEEKSGGVAMNIGVHLFDMLLWMFGRDQSVRVEYRDERRIYGTVQLERARVRWFLSVDPADLPESTRAAGRVGYRSMIVDGQEVEFTDGFADLHTTVYREILEGRGFGIADVRPSTELLYRIRTSKAEQSTADTAAFLREGALQ